ncbi:glycyl-radical enzyme activating protein [Chloroflexota bacterium]
MTTTKVTGNVYNIQRFSIQDGPGIRTTVFLKGCPLRCVWCSNPESHKLLPEVAHRDSLCTGCRRCLEVCSEEAISVASSDGAFAVKIDREKCTNCGKCIGACIAGALKFYGQCMSVDEVFDEIKRDSLFYSNSGGGITIGGGEPLMQADFVTELFHRCRRIGIHTTLDTSGYASVSALEKVVAETDLVLYDLKLMSSKQHKQFTGKDNKVILRNAHLVIAKGVPMIIRIPLIPGINDSKENLGETASFVSELDNKLHTDLLPYHRFGESKYKMLDSYYELNGFKSPSREQVQIALEIFKQYGVDCAIQE